MGYYNYYWENIFLRPEEAMTEIWQKLVFKLKFKFCSRENQPNTFRKQNEKHPCIQETSKHTLALHSNLLYSDSLTGVQPFHVLVYIYVD